jgi:hypothetical protein
MHNTFFHIDISSMIRQGINCWFEYLLSQPVDFDVPVILHFLGEYFGLAFLARVFRHLNTFSDRKLFGDDNEDTNGSLMVQQSLSLQPHRSPGSTLTE